MFYRLRKFLKVSHMIRVYKIYVQPIIQFGVLAYGSTTNSILPPIDNKVNRLLRIIFFKKKIESTTKIREENNIYNKKQLKVSCPKLSNCSITVRLRKLCNCLLGLDPTFIKRLRKMKEKHAKIFAKSFLKNNVIGPLDIKNYIFG